MFRLGVFSQFKMKKLGFMYNTNKSFLIAQKLNVKSKSHNVMQGRFTDLNVT